MMKSILLALSSLFIAGCRPDAGAWYQPGDRPIFLADVLDHTSQSPMSVGFARYAAGASNDWTLSYDEVLVITKGEFSVLTGGKATTARAGEAIFLARGTPLTTGRSKNPSSSTSATALGASHAQVGARPRAGRVSRRLPLGGGREVMGETFSRGPPYARRTPDLTPIVSSSFQCARERIDQENGGCRLQLPAR
jgi:hypothetical protein